MRSRTVVVDGRRGRRRRGRVVARPAPLRASTGAALFDRRPIRRRAALGFLAGQGSVGTIRLLRDYLAWERHPVLRRRAEAIVQRMETVLR